VIASLRPATAGEGTSKCGVVLGVDPAFNRTGWAALSLAQTQKVDVVATGVIQPAGGSRAVRLLDIRAQFRPVLLSLEPDSVVMEEPGSWQRLGGTRRETVELLAMARAVMLVECAERGIPVHAITFRTIRAAVMGRGNARADDLIAFLRQRGIAVPPRPRGAPDLDVANAIVTALYGLMGRHEESRYPPSSVFSVR
jgi:Holliday junction resolvasome RuvABC endonuclease subunit